MRLLLKNGNNYSRIFKLNIGKKNQSIIGNIMLFEILKEYFPTAKNIDFHFSYFSNGNYHFSYKYFDEADGNFYDRKRYHNHVSISKGKSLSELLVSKADKRDIDEDDPIDMFMMNEPLADWKTRPIGHNFSVLAMKLNASGLKNIVWSTTIELNEHTDLIIDVEIYFDYQVSLGCNFYNLGNPTFDFSINPPTIDYLEKTISVVDDLVVKVYAVIIPKEDGGGLMI